MAPRSGAAPLPCLFKNNSDETKFKRAIKQAQGTYLNAAHFIEKIGINRVGFLTFTFADRVMDFKEAGRRFNNLNRRRLSRYPRWMIVMQRHKTGAIHFHLLVEMAQDIRTGFLHEEVKIRNYKSVSPYLRCEWRFWRKACPSTRFGRHELKPIKAAESASRYIASYLTKGLIYRRPQDKGARLVRYSKGWQRVYSNRAGNSPYDQLWRAKLAVFARTVLGEGLCNSGPCLARDPFDMLRLKLGNRWAYRYREHILAVVLITYPSLAVVEADLISKRPTGPNIFDVPPICENFHQEALLIYAKSRRKRREQITENVNLWENVAYRFG